MLSPYRVLDLSDDRGIFCSFVLGELGADVVCVEPPGGSRARRQGPFAGDVREPERSLFWWAYARNRRSVVLDPESPGDREALLRLITSRFLYTLNEAVDKAREMGSYQLVERLGAGGMGEVWRAEHRTLARPAAIKLVRPEALGAGDTERARRTLQRFEREARATATLGSPHTIELYDFGTSQDGSFYYVMELLEGMDLESLIQRYGPISPERATYLLLQACHSLRDAHESGVIHRDIKPANIYVCRKGIDSDFIKVLDFGLVKFTDTEEQDDDDNLTADGAVLGTPAYMPPEIVRGEEATASSDIYALGCVAYWLLTGHLVFEARGLAVLLAHAQEPPTPPSQVSEQPIPEPLEAVILRCLAKESTGRPANMAELADELRATGLMENWSSERAERWWSVPGRLAQ